MGWKQAAVNFAAAVLRIRDVTHGAHAFSGHNKFRYLSTNSPEDKLGFWNKSWQSASPDPTVPKILILEGVGYSLYLAKNKVGNACSPTQLLHFKSDHNVRHSK